MLKQVVMYARGKCKNILLGTYYKNYYRELENLLYIYKVNDVQLVRVGAPNDGGYIMLDDFITGGGGSIFIRYRLGNFLGRRYGKTRL